MTAVLPPPARPVPDQTEGSTQLIRRQLGDAISRFIDDQIGWHDNHLTRQSGVYPAMREELGRRRRAEGRATAGSRPPGNTDTLAWLLDVDRTAATFPGAGGGTVYTLRTLSLRPWTKDEIPTARDILGHLERWTRQSAEILAVGFISVELRGTKCPICRESHAHLGAGQDRRKVAALLITERSGAVCRCCSSTWPVDRLQLLAAMIAEAD